MKDAKSTFIVWGGEPSRAWVGLVGDGLGWPRFRSHAPVPLRTPESWRMVEAVLDTGYSEELSIPESMAVGLLRERSTRVELADGSQREFNVVAVRIEWGGAQRTVDALITGSIPLVGVRLLQGFRLEVEFIPGGRVAVTPLDASQ